MSNLVAKSANRFQNIFNEVEQSRQDSELFLPNDEKQTETAQATHKFEPTTREQGDLDLTSSHSSNPVSSAKIARINYEDIDHEDSVADNTNTNKDNQVNQPRYLGKLTVAKVDLKAHQKEIAHWKSQAQSRGTSLEEVIVDTCRQMFPW